VVGGFLRGRGHNFRKEQESRKSDKINTGYTRKKVKQSKKKIE
jgi:hypothetical protein